MHETFMFTKPADFSVALGAADLEATIFAGKIALSTTMYKAIDEALLTETVTLETEDIDDTVEVPMTDTTYMLPAEKTTVINALFNATGNFADNYSLVTQYLSLTDFEEKIYSNRDFKVHFMVPTRNIRLFNITLDQNFTPSNLTS